MEIVWLTKCTPPQISKSQTGGLTMDGWTSCATQSFTTITVHYITVNWVITNPFLQTRAVYESHTIDHLSEILQELKQIGKLTANATIPVTSWIFTKHLMFCTHS